MIVCHCRVVDDESIDRAVREGARSVAQVCRATGAGRDCGSCIFTVKRLLCQHGQTVQSSFVEVEGAAS